MGDIGVFGYHIEGGAVVRSLDNTIRGTRFTAPETGNVESIAAFLQITGAAHDVKAAIYRDSDDVEIGEMEERTLVVDVAGSWYIFDAIGSPPITAGTKYILQLWADNPTGDAEVAHDAGAVNQSCSQALAYNGWPNPATPVDNNEKYSVYCHYTPSSPTEAVADSFTKPAAITYGQAYLYDADSLTGWTEYLHRVSAVEADQTIQDGDILQVAIDFNDAGAGGTEFAYYEYDVTDITTNTYGDLHIKYKTSALSSGAKLELILLFTDSTAQTISLPYSTDFIVRQADITPGKTIDKIQLYALEDPGHAANGTYYVYLDWLMIHEGTFEFPHVSPGGIYPRFHANIAKIVVPGRDGPIIQRLGMDELAIIIRGNMQAGETWGSTGARYGEYFMDIMRGRNEVTNTREPWTYLFTDMGNYQVILEQYEPILDSEDKAMRGYIMTFVIMKLSGHELAWWNQRAWYGKQV